LDGSHFKGFFEEHLYIRHGRVERCQNQRLGRSISQSLVHGVEIELSEAIPGLIVVVDFFIAVEPAGVVVSELRPNNFLLLVVEDILVDFIGSLHPGVLQYLRYTKA
jgi:hypothetical protein